jgi:hypothetical protein
VYGAVLTIHSWIRWLALLLGVGATINAFRDPATDSPRPPGAGWDTSFQLTLDVQLLFGLLLYLGLSPFTRDALNDFQASMQVPALRFWAVGHVTIMFAAVGLVRAGRVLAMNAKTPADRRFRRLICFSLAMVLLAAGIPWPGLSYGRPLFRF